MQDRNFSQHPQIHRDNWKEETQLTVLEGLPGLETWGQEVLLITWKN